jgi:hypothetical protein
MSFPNDFCSDDFKRSKEQSLGVGWQHPEGLRIVSNNVGARMVHTYDDVEDFEIIFTLVKFGDKRELTLYRSSSSYTLQFPDEIEIGETYGCRVVGNQERWFVQDDDCEWRPLRPVDERMPDTNTTQGKTPEELRQEAVVRGFTSVLEDPEPDEWFYLSFADAALPEGEQFLGGVYVRGRTLEAAITRSHLLGINPGGGIKSMGPVSQEAIEQNVPEGDRERLLTREEVEER